MAKKYYEVSLCRVAWYCVLAEDEEEAKAIAREKGDNLEDYDDQEGEPYYVPEVITKKQALEDFGKENILE